MNRSHDTTNDPMAPGSGEAGTRLRAGLIGGGSIARVIARAIAEPRPAPDGVAAVRHRVQLIGALVHDTARARAHGFTERVPLITTLDEFLAARPAQVAECAGHGGLAEYGARILGAGIDLVVASVGALADSALEHSLREAARGSGARIHIPSGAVGALDALSAARFGGLTAVRYVGRKPIAAWRGTRAVETVDLDRIEAATTVFEGSAREAALAFPQNANVCAAIALAGVGMDATQVRLVADPLARGNEHEIEAEGSFGTLRFSVVGKPLAENPKTSSLAAYSLLRALVSPSETLAIG